MSELPRTDDHELLDADRLEEAFAAFSERVRELEAVADELRAELRTLRAGRVAAPAFDDEDEEWPAGRDAAPPPSPDWVGAVRPPFASHSAAPRLVAEGAFLVLVALLAGLADLSAPWIALVMIAAWALVALSEWAAAAKRASWHLDEIARPARPPSADLDTTGPWDMPVVQATAIETADQSESRTMVATLPPEAESREDTEQTMAPATPPGRRLRFWRRSQVETTPDPWEA
jgi:hypothetical protein